MKIAIIGCGLIGVKRAKALESFPEHELVVCADVSLERAVSLASHYRCDSFSDWRLAVKKENVDAVIVATTHAFLKDISLAAVSLKKHVLVEKPGARSADELKLVVDEASRQGVHLAVGFNHRYHPALMKAHEVSGSGGVGDIMYVRARYGHGGRLGYEKEWRAQPELSGGGELLDQGVHLLDLSRWFLGDLKLEYSAVPTCFWKMPVDDNAFLALKNEAGALAWLHASWTEWRNTFSFEVFGKTGKLEVSGLGGSYGTERLTYYKMNKTMEPPEVTAWEWLGQDKSFEKETADFLNSRGSSAQDALAALSLVGQVYRT